MIAEESIESKVVLQPIYVPDRVPDLVPDDEGEENAQPKEDQNDVVIDATVGVTVDVIENDDLSDEIIKTEELNRQQLLPSFIQSTVSGLSLEADTSLGGVTIGKYIDSNQDQYDLDQEEDSIAKNENKELVAEIFEEIPTTEVMEYGFHVNPFMDCRLRSDENPCNPLMVNIVILTRNLIYPRVSHWGVQFFVRVN